MRKKEYMKNRKINNYIIFENYAEIIIDSETFGRFNIKIDLDDLEKCKEVYWGISKCTGRDTIKIYFYASNNEVGLLHRYIMNCPSRLEIDHIDQNTLDNRKSNLRIVTNTQNKMNRNKKLNNTSGYIGVAWVKRISRWMAYITRNKIKINLGYYNTAEEANRARLEAEKEIFGEFSPRFNQ